MADYIKREDAENLFKCDLGEKDQLVSKQGVCIEAVFRLESIPSADVRPVIRARWVEYGSSQPMSCDKCYCCSNCHGNRRYGWRLKPFCEECGAQMDADMREVQDG